MARRGLMVREHMLYVAKDLFLEAGFERASMDEIATRAETSKRTLYAHFESKELLYLAVIELVRGLIVERLGVPGDGGEDTAAAVTAFCGRFLGMLLYGPSIRMSRMVLAEAQRFPEGAAQYFEAVFGLAERRLADFLRSRCAVDEVTADAAAERLLARTMYPRHTRALYGVDPTEDEFAGEGGVAAVDVRAIRAEVDEVLRSFTVGRRS